MTQVKEVVEVVKIIQGEDPIVTFVVCKAFDKESTKPVPVTVIVVPPPTLPLSGVMLETVRL